MFSQPKYLDIEQQLYPTITLEKLLVFDNEQDGFHFEISERLVYDSSKRSIHLTEPLNYIINKMFKSQTELSIFVFDPYQQGYRSFATYPFQSAIVLTEQFLEVDIIFFKIKEEENPFQNIMEYHQQVQEVHLKANANQSPASVQAMAKSKRKKTIKEMLETVDEWRKLCIKSSNKMSLQEGSQLIGISKRTLQFYIHNIKLGQKYGYQFQKNMQKKITELKKFVDQKQLHKKVKQLQMLNTLKKMSQ